MKNKRPFVYLCTGMSVDGKISSSKRVQTRITNDDDRNFLYDLRIPCDAIMVGGRTAILDDPGLTVKSKARQKKRLALGKSMEPVKVGIVSDVSGLKLTGEFFNKGEAKKIIFTTQRSPRSKITELKKIAEVYVFGRQKVNLNKSLAKLYSLGANFDIKPYRL